MKTRLLSLLGGVLLAVVVTACGGDDGNNSGSHCGDGHVTGSEKCDDGNTTNGDGCSSTCTVETTCGNNVVEAATETCDDGNTASGDGCDSTCHTETSGLCGNHTVDSGEQCDDGNTTSGDGCSATCMNESSSGGGTCTAPSTITLTAMGTDMVGTATGDTTNSTDNVPEADCDGFPAGGGKDNVYKFTTTDVRDVIIIMTPDTSFDGGIRLMTACDPATMVTDQMLDDGCSDSGYEGDQEYLLYVNLPAGTYYVSVDGYDNTFAGTYTLDITASMPACGDGAHGDIEYCDDGNTNDGDGCSKNCTVEDGYNCDSAEPSVCQAEGCGDGIIQTGEDCDDDDTDNGDGCSSTCTIETGYSCTGEPSVCSMIECGNGVVEPGEECDDGNMANGDRCTTGCLLESDVTEAAEPNDSTPQVLTAGSHIIRGTFTTDPANDVDLYRFTLTATSKVEIETYGTINGTSTDYDGVGNALFDCPLTADDPEVAVFPSAADTTDDAMAMAIDDDDGDHYCSYLGANDSDEDDGNGVADPTQLAALPAGTYTIRLQPSVFAFDIPAGTRYMLDLKITPMGSSGPVAPAAGDLKINEFLAADGGSTNGGVDSNCDGALTDSNDEFLELVNVSNKTLDLTGVTYSDAVGIKFTFAAQTTGSLTLAPGKAVVIWGGGTPNCPGVSNFFTNGTSHTLSLNDAGDTITIATGGATPVTIATTTYGSATIAKSFNLDPDVTGTTYKLHNLVTGATGNLSPGKKADGSAF